MEISVLVTDTSQKGADGIDSVFWEGKWQILINATLSGSAHGGRRVDELGGGGCSLLLFPGLFLSPLFEIVSLTHSLSISVLAFSPFSPFLWLVHSSSIFRITEAMV